MEILSFVPFVRKMLVKSLVALTYRGQSIKAKSFLTTSSAGCTLKLLFFDRLGRYIKTATHEFPSLPSRDRVGTLRDECLSDRN